MQRDFFFFAVRSMCPLSVVSCCRVCVPLSAPPRLGPLQMAILELTVPSDSSDPLPPVFLLSFGTETAAAWEADKVRHLGGSALLADSRITGTFIVCICNGEDYVVFICTYLLSPPFSSVGVDKGCGH